MKTGKAMKTICNTARLFALCKVAKRGKITVGPQSAEGRGRRGVCGMNDYPPDWPEIAARIKEAAGWKCERCRHPHEVETDYVLTVHHLDGNKANCADWNLAALCQRCHLTIQGRVKMNQGFFKDIIPVSEWFKPHLEGFLRARRKKRL